jgi:hypothetical protein
MTRCADRAAGAAEQQDPAERLTRRADPWLYGLSG